jgi:hypothetical protein
MLLLKTNPEVPEQEYQECKEILSKSLKYQIDNYKAKLEEKDKIRVSKMNQKLAGNFMTRLA